MSKKYVYMFSEGNASMRNLLGGKGANLAEMTILGLPIPQGFTITTEACTEYNEGGKKLTDEMIEQIEVALGKLEEMAGKKTGRSRKSPAGFRSFRCKSIHARYDGHSPEPGSERCFRRRSGKKNWQPQICL